MGESKRRKLLDPNYGKISKSEPKISKSEPDTINRRLLTGKERLDFLQKVIPRIIDNKKFGFIIGEKGEIIIGLRSELEREQNYP